MDYQKNYLLTLKTIQAVAILEAAKINQTHNVTVNTTEDATSTITETNTQTSDEKAADPKPQ